MSEHHIEEGLTFDDLFSPLRSVRSCLPTWKYPPVLPLR